MRCANLSGTSILILEVRLWLRGVGFVDEGLGDAELAFAQQVHDYGAVDEVGLGGDCGVFGDGEVLSFEFLDKV